ncbi:MAG TPA: class I SAM-dependent methyltransferase [Limnochordia bacterium]
MAWSSVWQDPAVASAFVNERRRWIPLAEEQLLLLRRIARASHRPVRRLLDVGCGDGILAEALLQEFPGAHAVLLDISEPMLAAARRRFQGRAVTLVAADLNETAWMSALGSEGPFDVVVSGYCIHHLPDERKRAVYADIFGLLAPGGLFLNLEHVASATAWGEGLFNELMIDALHEGLSKSNPRLTRAEVARGYLERPDRAANRLAPLEAQLGWLREIGFESVDCFFKCFELALFGGARPAA